MRIYVYNVNKHMKIETLVRLIAGTFVVVGVVLTHTVNVWWLLLPLFVGLNLVQSSFTGFCPPSIVLRKLGWLDDSGVIHWGGQTKL
jgi:hypothetical protein